MPYHDSPSPVKRPSVIDRTSSTHSLSRASPSATTSTSHKATVHHKLHKAHTGHGRLPHGRNPSYGKNLNKLSKLTAAHGGDGPVLQRNQSKSKIYTPSTSPQLQHTKRNSSNISLSRTGSKISMRRNSSNLSLKRNGSTSQLGKVARPETPLRRSHSHRQEINELASKNKANFTVGSDGQDEEWTEESNSQSPATTRQSSVGPGESHSKDTSSDDEVTSRPTSNLPVSPPQSAPGSPTQVQKQPDNHQQSSSASHYDPRSPDADAVTSRLLHRNAPQNIPPHLSSVSAVATPGTHTPPPFHGQDSTLNVDRSMPENGVSRFLNTTGSSSGSATPGSVAQLHTALNQLHESQNHGHRNGNRSTPPESATPPLDPSRRVKSAASLPSSKTTTKSANASPPSYDVPPQPRRRAGNTQFRLDLWRGLSNKEPSHGPPAPLIQGVHNAAATGMMSAEERRMRQWEVAEQELDCLRRFQNPVLEGVGRVMKADGKKAKLKPKEPERGRDRGATSGVNGTADGIERSSRPASSAGRGRVRFEIGAGEEGAEEEERGAGNGANLVQQLLRRMWEGPGTENSTAEG
ncbi:hypothetical protein MMC24_001264 [Lignoscripta atroalba]|nr:hypothetical protein [Lignoscripta atroalba]